MIGNATMNRSLQSRIEATFIRDRIMAIVFIAMVWLAVGFVYFAVNAWVDDTGVRVALSVAAALILLFNSASMIAMIRHYAEDKQFIYELDIRHLDESRAAKTGEPVVVVADTMPEQAPAKVASK
jgi:hypothetical protein